MATKMKFNKSTIGHWIFLVGILLSLALGFFFPASSVVAGLLVLLGIVVGLWNITADEVNAFLVASIALIISAESMKFIPLVGAIVSNIVQYITLFVAPAAFVVALISVWKLASAR